MDYVLAKPLSISEGKTVETVKVRQEANAGDLLEVFALAQSFRREPTQMDLAAASIAVLTGLSFGNVRSLKIGDFRKLAGMCDFIFFDRSESGGGDGDTPKAI